MVAMACQTGLSDIYVVNSCAVTAEAVRQARQQVRRAARENPDCKIIVTGCAAQIDPDMFRAMPEVSAVLGNHEKMQPASWRALAADTAPPVSDIMRVTGGASAPTVTPERARAYLEIQNGCDHRCTFCIIPYGRGNSRSVPLETVCEEARLLADAGYGEIVLTGVDITSWGGDLDGSPVLGQLVAAILKSVPELPRLRLSSIDGAEIDPLLKELITGEARLAPYLHLSLQSGSTMILKRMKRRHSREQAISFCEELLAKRPELAFGADIIAGFPTETEDMFADSLSLVAACSLRYLHVFPYSARQGTPAALMPQVPGGVIRDRAARLRAAGDAALSAFLESQTGRTGLVLTEKSIPGGLAKGRLANFAEVSFATKNTEHHRPGHFCTVALTGHDGRRLTGKLTGGLS